MKSRNLDFMERFANNRIEEKEQQKINKYLEIAKK